MNSNYSKKSLDNTKITYNHSGTNQKSFLSISDINKLIRRQEIYKKKFKSLVQTNALTQAKIKIYQSSIKDERSTLTFQLNELSKTMNSKISSYVDEKLDRDQFVNNDMAQQTIKEMIGKFQEVEKQTKVNKSVYKNLNSIYEHYIAYSQQIEKLVEMTMKSNKQYQDSMKNMLEEKHSQIMNKKLKNEEMIQNTQICIKKIQQYDQGKVRLIQEEQQLRKYLQKLLEIQAETKNQVEKFHSWAKIVIDKNHRKIFHKQNKQKQNQWRKLTQKNNNLEMTLHQLESEQEKLKQLLLEKQNNLTVNQKIIKNSNSRIKTKREMFNLIKS